MTMIEDDKNDTSEIKLEDYRHNYHLKDHTTKKRLLLIFVVTSILLPLVDFFTDVQLVVALGFPLMIGWNVCLDKRNTEDPTLTTKYGDGPTWTLDGENCGFIDQRIDPIIYANEQGSPSYSGGGPPVQAGRVNSAQGPVPDADGNMYHPSDIEDPCRLSTSQGACYSSDLCRWGKRLATSIADECYDPVLDAIKSEFTPPQQTYSHQEIDKLYCAEFQSYHRLFNTSATAVKDICERHVYVNDGSRVCEYDPKGELCVIKEAFAYLDTPDPCSAYGNAQAGNMAFNSTAESFCNANPFCIYGAVYSPTGTSAAQSEQNLRNRECRDYQRYKWLFYADGTYPQDKTNLCTAWMYKADQNVLGYMNKLDRTNLIRGMTADACNSILDQYGRKACVYNEWWATSNLSPNIYNDDDFEDDTVFEPWHYYSWQGQASFFGDDLRDFNELCYGHVDGPVGDEDPALLCQPNRCWGSHFPDEESEFDDGMAGGGTSQQRRAMLEEKEAATKKRIAAQLATRRLAPGGGGGGPSRGDDWTASVDDQFLDNSFPSEDPAFIGAMVDYDAYDISETTGCASDKGCVLGLSSAMHDEPSMEARLCSLCESCSGVIRENQVIAAQGGVESNTATTYFEFFDQVQKDVAKRRLCSTCQIIKGGKRCLPTSTTSSDAYRESCDALSMLPTDAARNSGMPYEMRAGHVWTDSPAYKGEQVDDLENLCFGIFVDYDGELIDLYNDKGTQCVRQYSKKPSYTTSEARTCGQRYITDVEDWFQNVQGMVECYSADSLEANDCLSFDEMTDYQHNPYTFAYESCEHKAPYPDLYTDCCNVYIGSDNSTAASPDKCSDKYPHDPTTSMGNLQYADQVTCDEACHCEFNWDYKKCLDISEAKYDREVLGNDPYEIVYMDKEPNTVPMYDTIWDAFQYCSQQYQESCCNSIVDSEGLVDSNGNRNQLCEFVVQGSYTFYNSSGGKEIENYGYCMPDAKQTFLTGKNNGTCKTSENCGCTKNGAVEFKTSNDEKCPHVQKCYLPVQDQCGAYEYDGLWSTVDTEGNYGKAYWQMYRSGSLYCKNTGGSVPGGPHKYHFTSIDQQSTGCGGFTMTFGCDTEDDQTLVGDMLKTNLAMYAYCDGSDEDECRRCNIFNLFERGDAANMYASGDYSESTNQDKDMLMDAQTRIFVALLLICFMKEMLGVAIMAVTYKVNGCIDPDIDYVTVGKDSIAGLAFLLVALYNMENNADRMLYAERYKSYMDGYSPEEIRENKHRRHEKEWKLAESDYLRRKARRQRRIDKGEEPGKEIEMPEILTHSVDAMDKEKTSIDSTGRVSIVLEDDLDIMPLIEPQTILFKLWVVFEFVESIAGLMFGLLFFFRLASINKPEDVPSYSAAASALVAALSSWCDLILNIIGHGWNPRGWIKYVKRFLQAAMMLTFFAFCWATMDRVYGSNFGDAQPGCSMYL